MIDPGGRAIVAVGAELSVRVQVPERIAEHVSASSPHRSDLTATSSALSAAGWVSTSGMLVMMRVVDEVSWRAIFGGVALSEMPPARAAVRAHVRRADV